MIAGSDVVSSLPFRFDATRHVYLPLEPGDPYPHITGMLEECGLSPDPTWFTLESKQRGTAVHKLTADYDLGALDVPSCTSRYRGYLLGHVAMMNILRPDVLEVEQASVHPTYKFAGRPDRVWSLDGAIVVPDIKTGPYEDCHPIQTALQAILVSLRYRLPAPSIGRFGIYLKPTGKFKVEQFNKRADFDEALRVIRRCC